MSNAFDPGLWRHLSEDPVSEGLIRRRILPSLPHDVFIGELRPGHERVLILEIMGSHDGLPERRPSSRGLRVDVMDQGPSSVKMRLMSTTKTGVPLFEELADDIAGVLAADPGDGAAARVLERIIAWQTFFATKRDDFSLEQAAGLFAELYVLRTAFLPSVGAAKSVAAWSGPEPAVQDFQLGDLAVEVKSFRGTGAGHLTITSERQLELTGVQSLYIAYLRLDQRAEGSGTTLLEAIDTLREAAAASAFAADLLERKLLAYGWHDSYASSRSEKYAIRDCEFFYVNEEFPRIVSGDLPGGIGSVSYYIDRSAIGIFLVPFDQFSDALKGL